MLKLWIIKESRLPSFEALGIKGSGGLGFGVPNTSSISDAQSSEDLGAFSARFGGLEPIWASERPFTRAGLV